MIKGESTISKERNKKEREDEIQCSVGETDKVIIYIRYIKKTLKEIQKQRGAVKYIP